MENGVTLRDAQAFRVLCCTSVYRTASTGDTLPAILPGRAQDSSTVSRANAAAPRKIQGDRLMVVYVPLMMEVDRVMGTASTPTP